MVNRNEMFPFKIKRQKKKKKTKKKNRLFEISRKDRNVCNPLLTSILQWLPYAAAIILVDMYHGVNTSETILDKWLFLIFLGLR